MPMPERTRVTIEPTSGTSIRFSFGSIHYTEEDIGKTYVYTITEELEVKNVINDTAKTVRVYIGDRGDGTLQISSSTQQNPLVFVNEYQEPEKISISGGKTWIQTNAGGAEKAERIIINLLADGVRIRRQVVTADQGWKWTFADLDKYDENGKEIVYTVTEEPVEGYTTVVKGYDVTNIRNPEETTQAILKVWEDMEDISGIRPQEITVVLLADGEPVESVTLNPENEWFAEVEGLPQTKDGRKIVYTWQEVSVEGYTVTSVKEGNLTILTNTHEPELTQVSIRKIWDDDEDAAGLRPKKLVVKLSNGMCVVLDENNGWSATIENLPVTYAGEPVEYYWIEPEVPGYVLSQVETEGELTTYHNSIPSRPELPPEITPPKVPGKPTVHIDEYDTPLGVEVIINHVGDCFE